jgi:signal transduction histidine kinase
MSDRADRERVIARRVAIALVVAFVVLWVLRIVLGISTGSLVDQESRVLDLLFGVGLAAFTSLFVLIGWTIVTRQPRNTIGWLLLTIPVFFMGAFVVGDYATEALVTNPGSLPFGRAAAWLDRWLLPVGLAILIPIFLFFPDGSLPSKRWRPVLWLYVVATVTTVVSWAVTPGKMNGALADLVHANVTNPLGIDALAGSINAITQIAGFALLASAFLAGAAIFVRYRSASIEVRRQIRWLVYVAVAFLVEFAVGIVLTIVTHDNDAVGNVMFTVWFFTIVGGIPIACGLAIVKYQLYELDVVIRKAVVVGLLALFITLVYAGIVAGVGALVSSQNDAITSFLAAAVLAVAFQPARERASRIADRLVYGKRATPYEVLAEFSERVGEAYASDDVLTRMAKVLRDGTGAAGARVLLRVGEDEHEAAVVGELTHDEARVEVVHQGEHLGALAVSMPANDPMDPSKLQLIDDLASQAGLVLRNVRLIEELRASRQRLVAAQDEERRKLERNLHDGAQQQLVALAVQLKLLEQTAGKDPQRDQQLAAKLGSQATAALEDLRDLARGIYPPLLADKGLAAALENQARKAAVPTTVEADEVGRYPQEIEATIYFCTLEALNNVAKYAEASRALVRLSQRNGHIEFAVEDDGRGFDASAGTYGTGLQGMADRLDAVGGELRVESTPGAGSTVSGSVPVEHRS